MKKDKWVDKKVFKKFAGKWVGLCDNNIVAHNEDAGKVIDLINKKCGDKKTTIFKVPEKNQILLL